jgi:NhaP-type Na+/H+ or K+/H+ antiporter
VFCGLGLNILFGHSPNEKTGEVRERQSAMISVAKFDTDLFFLLLLPPIIFEAGYNMQRRKFFANLGAICCYAFIGTAVSAVIIAAFVYYAGQLGTFFGATAADDGFNGLESLIFGSLISATDPVTVLAIFGAMKADLDLYSLVFGESVLNDAVAIVLYRTLDEFNPAKCGDNCEVSMGTVTGAVGNFLVIFLGSTAIGVAIGLFSALLYKHTRLYEEEFEALEMVLLILFPYMSWMLAEAMKLSGIVSILFCGIIMAHYTTRNLHPKTEAFRCAPPQFTSGHIGARGVSTRPHGGRLRPAAGSSLRSSPSAANPSSSSTWDSLCSRSGPRQGIEAAFAASVSALYIFFAKRFLWAHGPLIHPSRRCLPGQYEQDWRHFPIIVVSIVGMLVSRIFNIVPNTALINWCPVPPPLQQP